MLFRLPDHFLRKIRRLQHLYASGQLLGQTPSTAFSRPCMAPSISATPDAGESRITRSAHSGCSSIILVDRLASALSPMKIQRREPDSQFRKPYSVSIYSLA